MPPRDAQRARRKRQRKQRINATSAASGSPNTLTTPLSRPSLSQWIAGVFPRARRESFKRRFLPITCFLFGAVLLTYVATQYAEMYRSQKHMAAQWTAQEHPSANAGTIDPTLTRLIIPKINLDSFVVEGTSHKALLHGPSHLKNSAEPGQPGNVVISAHRDTFFRHVYELEKGDQVQIERGGKTALYEVTGKKVVDPDDVEVLRQTKEPRLTLITCYPTYYIGPAPQRAIVFAKLVSLQESTPAPSSTAAVH